MDPSIIVSLITAVGMVAVAVISKRRSETNRRQAVSLVASIEKRLQMRIDRLEEELRDCQRECAHAHRETRELLAENLQLRREADERRRSQSQ